MDYPSKMAHGADPSFSMNKIFALTFRTFLLALALVAPVNASNEDAAFGHYTAVGGKTSLSFDWDEEGIHHFRLNGRLIKETLNVEEHEKSSSVQIFEIGLPARGDRQQWLQMLVLFDANGMKAAAGFLSDKELVKVGTGAEVRVRSAQVLELRRQKLAPKR